MEMEKAITAVALIVLGTIIVAYGKDLIPSGKRMLSAYSGASGQG